MVYPADLLSSISGKTITKISFYFDNRLEFGGGTLSVRVGEVNTTNAKNATGLTEVWSGSIPTSGTTLEFDVEDFDYNGGNLAIETYVVVKGTYKEGSTFLGVTAADGASYCNKMYDTEYNFLPQVTFEFSGETAPYASKLTGVTGNSYNFGNLAVGSTSTLNLSLKNTGANSFTPSVTVTGAGFSSTYTAAELTNGQTATIPVVFAPTSAGDFSGNISINCGDAGSYSIDLTGIAVLEKTIADASDNNEYLPVYGYNHNEYNQQNQMLYPASMLTDLVGKKLKSITFYPATVTQSSYYGSTTTSGINFKNGSATVSLATAEAGTITYSASGNTRQLESELTAVGTISIPSTAQTDLTEWTIPFGEDGFTYEGGDLLVDVSTVKGSYGRTYFYGQTTTDYAGYSCTSSSAKTGQNFLPKVTFAYEDSETPATPVIEVEPESVTITTAPTTTGTATFTVTGTNLTNDITLTASNGFTVTPTTIAAADAANGVTVTVAYPASNVGTFNGTITITSNGATEKIVNVTANVQEVIAEGTVTPTALNFGEVLVGQSATAQQIKVSNTGSETFTPSFSIDNSVFTIDEPTAIAGGTSIYYNVNYTPTAAGTDNGTLTVTFGGNTFTVTLMGKGTELAGYDITSSAASGVHNFGDVFKDGIATWNVTLTNNGANAVTPVIEWPANVEGFSAENVPATLAAGQSATITFKFAPTAIQAYGPTSVVVKFAETTEFQFDYTFRGNGIENTGTLPPSTFDNETYTWTDDNGDTHTSPYSEIATDPNQMIALLKAVYTNKNIPGNYYRGYTTDKTPQDEVAYPAIGAIARNYTSGAGYTHDFYDAYGWGMAHDETAYPMSVKEVPGSTYNKTYYVMNPNEYKPNQEGVTLLLVEMNDGVGASTTTTRPTDYASLKNLYGTMFKSVRVIPNSKKVTKTIDVNGTATEVPGTLFKVDCDKMNRFFFLAKGRLRFYPGEGNASAYFLDQVKSSGSGSSYTWYDKENTTATVNPFNAMYEQFSPVDLNNAQESSDVYQLLINMESYDVEHDCEAIPWASTNGVSGHEFNMYGKSSISDDCQDVRDLMFFVPDYRMMYWSGRDKATNSDEYTNYYKQFAPNMGMYVIVQNDITGAQNGTANEYVLNLSWQSNLTDFVPGESGVYTIYKVNDDGTYTQVATNIPSSQTTYQVTVPMLEHGQQVTYVIQGQDNTGFLSLQFSNEESFIIPGTDADEVFQLVPNADIYSRFDPAQETNFYANGMQIKTYPGVATTVYAGKTLNYYRKAAGENEWTKVATAAVNSDATQATVATVEGTQRQQSEYIYGYKANASTMTIAADGHGYNVFGVIYDNFKASVEGNNHPNYYNYKVEIDGENAHSNEITVRVFKTAMSTIDGEFDKTTVDEDLTHTVGLEKTAFDIDVQHSSKTEVLRYGAYRWTQSENPAILSGTADAEEDISPNGQASNQGEYYTVYMNGDSFIGEDVYVAQGETAQASFEDNVPDNNPDAYVYAPVVETFTGRADYNTYGAPMQTTATGKTELTVGELSASTYTFTPEGKTGDYVYYNIPLTANVTIPENYDIYKMRAWRLIDKEWLGEIDPAYANRVNPDYLYETLEDASKGQPIPVGIDVITRPGTNDQNVLTGTFGAKKLAEGESFTAKFIVRTYFTRTAETSTFNAAQSVDGKYYITETVIDVPVTNQVITGVINVNAQKAVAGVMYYNLAGMQSEEPFSGVNIVVTRYTDGSISTAKVLK